jgi:hypothetical protein
MTDESKNNVDLALLDILQAHDILLSILLGKTLGKSKDPAQDIQRIVEIIELQDINDAAKEHLFNLLQPLKENIAK